MQSQIFGYETAGRCGEEIFSSLLPQMRISAAVRMRLRVLGNDSQQVTGWDMYTKEADYNIPQLGQATHRCCHTGKYHWILSFSDDILSVYPSVRSFSLYLLLYTLLPLIVFSADILKAAQVEDTIPEHRTWHCRGITRISSAEGSTFNRTLTHVLVPEIGVLKSYWLVRVRNIVRLVQWQQKWGNRIRLLRRRES